MRKAKTARPEFSEKSRWILNNKLLVLAFLMMVVRGSALAQCPSPQSNAFQHIGTTATGITPATIDDPVFAHGTWGNNYVRVHVVSGEKYELTLVGSEQRLEDYFDHPDGVVPNLSFQRPEVDYDPMITLLDNTGTDATDGAVVGFNEDFSPTEKLPQLEYTATYTGELYVHIDMEPGTQGFNTGNGQTVTIASAPADCSQLFVDSTSLKVTRLAPLPVLSSAILDNATQIRLTYSKNVQTNGTNPTDFAVTDGIGTNFTVSTQADGTAGDAEIVLTIADVSAAVGDLTVSYTNNNNEISDFDTGMEFASTGSVVIDTDTVLPTLASATKDTDTQITVTLSERIQTNETNPTDFTVSDNNATNFAVSAQVDDTANDAVIVLTVADLSTAVAPITLTYTNNNNEITDFGSNSLATDGTGVSVSLNPTLVSGTKNTDTQITLTYDQNVQTNGTNPTDFIVVDGLGTGFTVSNQADGTAGDADIVLTMSDLSMAVGDLTVTYTNNNNEISDAATGTKITDTDNTGVTIDLDNTVPTLASATKDTDTQITLTLSELVQTNGTNPTDFTVTDGLGTNFAVSAQVDGTAEDTDIVLTVADLSTAIGGLTITYTNTNNEITDFGSNSLATDATGVSINSTTGFITTWQTTGNNESITIPINTDESGYNYTVIWGDGDSDVAQTGNVTHSYTTAGTYTVTIEGDFPAIRFLGSGDKDKIMTIEQWGDISWTTMVSAFESCSNLQGNATDAPNLSGVTDMTSMFNGASTFNQDINNWDVSNVTNMTATFFSASAFNQNINSWDVSSVTNMSFMFRSASAFNGDISSWDVSSVSNMSFTFAFASAFNRDISGWDVSSVTSMFNLFQFASAFNQDLGSWSMAQVTNVSNMLIQIGLSVDNYDATLEGWANQTLKDNLSLGATSLEYCNEAARQSIIDTYNWTITNDVLSSTCPPRVVSATKDSDTQITITFNKNVQTNEGNPTDFTVIDGVGTNFAVSGQADGTAGDTDIVLTVADVSTVVGDLTVTYTNNNNEISDEATGTEFGVSGNATIDTDSNVPSISTATKDSDTQITLSFSEPVQTNGTNPTDFTVVDGLGTNFAVSTQVDGVANDINIVLTVADLSAAVGDLKVTYTNNNSEISDTGNNDLPTDATGVIIDTDASGPTLVSVTKDSDTQVTVTLSEVVQTSETNPTDFTITDGMGTDFAVSGQVDGTAEDAEIVLTVADLSSAVGDLKVTYTNNNGEISDFGNNDLETDAIGVTADSDTSAPTLISGIKDAETQVTLTLSEQVQTSGTNPTDFIVTDGIGTNFAVSGQADGTAADTDIVLTVEDLSSSVGDLKVTYANNNGEISDFGSNDLETDAAGIIVDADIDAPTLSLAIKDSDTQISLSFNEPVQTNGTNPTDFIVTDGMGTNFAVSAQVDDTAEDTDIVLTVADFSTAVGGLTITYTNNNNEITDFGSNNLATDATGVSINSEVGFITTWQTTVDNEAIGIPTSTGTYNYTVFWGDGNFDANQTDDATHTYATAGTYTVTIEGTFPKILFNDNDDSDKIMTIEQWGNIVWSDFGQSFRGCENLQVTATDAPDLSGVTNLGSMFSGCVALNADLNNWDVSNVTDMRFLFASADIFNGNITSWNVSNVTNFTAMFQTTMFNQDISGWNVSSATTLSTMFNNTATFDQDISGWNVSNVTNFSDLFSSATAFNQDISGWDVSSATNMSGMFNNAEAFNQPIGAWGVKTALVTDMSDMFQNAESFNQDLNSWNVSAVVDMPAMFLNASVFNSNITSWDVSSVENMNTMFSGATAFNIDISGWDVSSVTNLSGMFTRVPSFNADISGWDVSSVTNMSTMFFEAGAFNADISNWDVSNVTNMSSMFARASIFNADISGWEVSNVTDMNNMFSVALAFNADISGWDVSSVTNMRVMFFNASAFDQDLGDWSMGMVTNPSLMLNGSGLSVENYDATLIGWATQTLQPNLTLGATNLFYCTDGETARQSIIDDFNWTFDGDALNASCPPLLASATLDSDTQITVSFDQNVQTNGTNPTDFTVTDGLGTNYVVSTQQDGTSGDMDIVLTVADLSARVGDLRIIYTNNNNEISDAATGDEFTDTDTNGVSIDTDDTAPTLVSATRDTDTQITVKFSEKVQTNGTNPTDFAVTDGTGATFAISAQADDTAQDSLVILTVADLSASLGSLTVAYTNNNNEISDFGNNVQASGNVPIAAPGAFVLKWNAADAEEWGTSLPISVDGSLTYDYNVFWGDGNFDINQSGNITHHYASDGIYTVTITGTFPRFLAGGENNQTPDTEAQGYTSLEQWGDQTWTALDSAFRGAKNLVYNASDAPDLSALTSLSAVFEDVQQIGSPDLSGWDVSSVTDFSFMFAGTRTFNGDITNWNMGSATTLKGIFLGATSFNQPIGGWNVSSVTDLSWAFGKNGETSDTPFFNFVNDNNLEMSFNQNIDGWSVGSVTNMEHVFDSNDGFNQPLNSWDVSSVTTMEQMFEGADIFNQDLNSWDVSNVTNMDTMFGSMDAFDGNISSWDVSNVTNMSDMFDDAGVFNQDISVWNVGQVTIMLDMFEDTDLFNQDISGWNVSNVTDMDGMFEDALAFNQDISGWDVSSVTTMASMFERAAVFNQSIGNWDVSNVTSMEAMFNGNVSFNQPIGSWDVSSVENMADMFKGSQAFNQDISGWVITTLEDAGGFLEDAEAFRQVNWDKALTAWASLTGLQGVSITASVGYCPSETDRQTLIDTFSWDITDAGQDCPPTLASATVIDNTTIEVTFNEALNTNEGNPTDFTVSDADDNEYVVSAQVDDTDDDEKIKLTVADLSSSSGVLTVTYANNNDELFDDAFNFIATNSTGVEAPDIFNPSLLSAIKDSDTQLTLTFNEAISTAGSNPTDFSVKDSQDTDFPVTSLTDGTAGDKQLVLTLSGGIESAIASLAITYTANNADEVQDIAGNDLQTDATGVQISLQPIVTAVTFDNQTTNIGGTVTITVEFDRTVEVTGSPTLSLVIGSTVVVATANASTGSSSLFFSYTVQEGDEDTDGVQLTSTSIDLNGGSIMTDGLDAVLTLNNVDDTDGVLVDGIRPDAPVIVSISDDTGRESADLVTNDNSLFVRGTAEPNSSLSLLVDGNEVFGGIIINVDDQGDWEFSPVGEGEFTVTEGVHTYTATTEDLAGNVSVASADFIVTVDQTAPDAPSVLSISEDSGDSSDDELTNDAGLIFNGTAEANSIVVVFIDGTENGTTTADGSGDWSYDATATTLDEGAHSITATATDVAGNASTESSDLSVTIDTTAPDAPTISGISDDTGSVEDDAITNDPTLTFSGSAESNGTVEVFIDGTSIGTASVDGSGNWSKDHETMLADGTYSVTASVTDESGNTSAVGTAFSITIDTVIPDVPAIASISDDTGRESADLVTNDNSLFVRGTAEPNSRLSLLVDGNEVFGGIIINVDDQGDWEFSPVGEGEFTVTEGVHTYTATTEDLAGNVSAVSADFIVTVDQTAPDAPSVLSISEDSGDSSDDELTNDTGLTFNGTAEANSTVTVFIDGAENGTTTADGSGDWSYDASATTLDEGAHSITATATDVAGNTSAESSALSVTIDTTAPDAPIITSISDDTGIDSEDQITNDQTLTFTGSAEANGTVEVFIDGTSIGSTSVDGSGAWSIAHASMLAEGDHTITATVGDNAGNVSAASENFAVTIDLSSPPAPEVISITTDTGRNDDDQLTNDQTLTFSGTSEANAVVDVLIDGVSIGTVSADGAGSWEKEHATSLGEGTYVITATATDAAGNTGASSTDFDVTIDLSAPDAPVVLSLSDDTGTSSEDELTNDTGLTFTGTAESNSTVTVFIDGTNRGTTTADASGNWNFDSSTGEAALVFTEGVHSVTATATDIAGNTSAEGSALSLTIDTTAPDAPTVASISNDTGTSDSDQVTSDQTLTFAGTSEGDAIVEVFIDGTSIGTSTADALGSWTKSHATSLAEGTYSITAQVTDHAGNTGSLSTVLSITIDTSAPSAPSVIAITSDTGRDDADQDTNDQTLTFSGTSEANAIVDVLIDGVSIGTVSADGAGSWEKEHATSLDEGVYAITATVTDAAGNVSSVSSALSVTIDVTAPIAPVLNLNSSSDLGISNTDDLTSDATPTIDGTAEPDSEVEVFVDGTSVGSTTTDSGGSWAITPTSDLDEGTLAITATATDVAGNVSGSSSSLEITLDLSLGITATTPVDNEIDVLPNVDLTITFDKNIVKGTGNVTIKQKNDDTVLETIDVTSSNVSISGSTATIDPVNLILPPNSEFYVNIDAGTFENNAGAPFEGISDNTTWSFNIIAASVVTSVSVPDDHTYMIGDQLDFSVDFTLPISIVGSPSLAVTVGTDVVEASLVGTVSNSSTATFRYIVVEGHEDTDGISIGSAIELNGATIRDEFDVNAILSLNNVGNLENVLVDGIRPDVPVISAISEDTGLSSSDEVTNDNELIFLGTAEANSTLTLIIDGTSMGTTTTDAMGNWSFDASSSGALADADYVVTATATDGPGNISDVSSNFNITIDTTAPDAPTIDLAASSDLGISDADNLTSDAIIILQGSAEANARVTVTLSTGTEVVTADSSGDWMLDTGSTLAEGNYQFSATATDAAGNVGASSMVLDVEVNLTLDLDMRSPMDNATEILVSSNLVLTFAESVFFGSGNIEIRLSANDGLVEMIDVTSARVTINGNEVTIDPVDLLSPAAADFYVLVDHGALTDNAGYEFTGISDKTFWSFATIADTDQDGVLDLDENINGNGEISDDDTDGDGVADYLDTDDDGDGIPTSEEDLDGDGDPTNDDSDNDGIPDYLDQDDDNDGIQTKDEDFNRDGDLKNDDNDNDGIPDYLDSMIIPDESNIPQGLSPDGDGANEVWRLPEIEAHPGNRVTIFSRWGSVVYETTGYDNASNAFEGKANTGSVVGSATLPDGTYYYVIDYGNGVIRKGFLVIKQ